MKVKRAETIKFYLCDSCAAVHIGLFRGGKLYAEAIPVNIEGVAADLAVAIAESKALKAGPPSTRSH